MLPYSHGRPYGATLNPMAPYIPPPPPPGVLNLTAPPTPEQRHGLRQGDYRNLHFLGEGAAHIRELHVHADMGHSLHVLSDLPRLEVLAMRGVDYAPGFDPGRLPALRRLNIHWHPDYPPLCAPLLETLFFYGLHAPDLRPMHAPVLRCLSINGNQLQSTRGVENFGQLEQLWLMQQHRLEDLSGVEQLHRLQKFTFHSFDEVHWQPPYPLQGLRQLHHIDILSRQRGVLFPELHWLHFIALSLNAEAQPCWESELRTIAQACGREVESVTCREKCGILHCSVLFKKPRQQHAGQAGENP